METMPTTTEQWAAVITDLAARREAAEARVGELRRRRSDLSLAAALGDAAAQRQLRETNAELAKAALELDALELAGEQAATRRREAERAAADDAERQRRARAAEALALYIEGARAIDDLLRLLAARFATARQHLDRAEASMTAQERAPLQQLRSLWGATLAAAHFGLGDHLSLGREAAHLGAHGKPLADHAAPYLDPWLQGDGAGGKE